MSATTGQSDERLAYVAIPARMSEPEFTVEESDRILAAHGFRPATPEESRRIDEALNR